MSQSVSFDQEIRKQKFFEHLWRICAITSGLIGIAIAISLTEPALISTSLFLGFLIGAFCMVKSSAAHKSWRGLREQWIHQIVEKDDQETESLPHSD